MRGARNAAGARAMDCCERYRVKQLRERLVVFLDAGHWWHRVHQLVHLLDDELQFLARTFSVEHPALHGERDAIHVLDLIQHLLRGAPELQILPLLGASAVEATQQVVSSEPLSELNRFLDRTAGNSTVVRQRLIADSRPAEPEAADVLETVVGEPDYDVAEGSVGINGREMVLGAEISHSLWSFGVRGREERIERFPELPGTLDVWNVATTINQREARMQCVRDIV